ncbi:MAG: hypothetical protein WBG10_01945, partial [Pseudolabrys sp.]
VEGAVGVLPLGKPDHDLNWHKSAFTHRALASAVTALLAHFKPGGKLSVPKAVKASAARFARVLGHSPARHRTPEAVGLSCAEGVMTQMQVMDLPQPGERPPQTRYADAFYRMAQVREDLAIDYGKPDGRKAGLSLRPKRRTPKPQKWPVVR